MIIHIRFAEENKTFGMVGPEYFSFTPKTESVIQAYMLCPSDLEAIGYEPKNTDGWVKFRYVGVQHYHLEYKSKYVRVSFCPSKIQKLFMGRPDCIWIRGVTVDLEHRLKSAKKD